MRGLLVIVGIGAALGLTGCGESCESTCQHVYDPSECGVVLPGVTPKELIQTCVRECNTALQKTGEMRFDPNQTLGSDDAWKLENEQEAAAWIDCVWSQAPEDGKTPACANIDPAEGGICAPI